MRRLAQGILGALAFGLMLIAQPWDLRDCRPPECVRTSDGEPWYWYVLATAVEVGLAVVILTFVLVGVLGIRDSGRASRAAVYAALGQSQGAAARAAARRGALDGALVTGVAYVAAGITHVAIVLSSGYGLFEQDAGLWLVRLVSALLFTGALTLAHVIDALRPRRTPVERLYEDAATPRARRIPLWARATVLLALAALCAGLLVGVAVTHDVADGRAGTVPTASAGAAVVGLSFLGIALFFAVVLPLAHAATRPALLLAARAVGSLKAARSSALLSARAATASAASARTLLAIGGLALIAGALCSQNPAPALAPEYLGTISVTPADAGAKLVAEYEALPGVRKAVVGQQYGDSPGVAVVDPADVADVDPVLHDLLTAHPRAVLTGSGLGGLTIDSLPTPAVHATGIVPISTCCMVFAGTATATGGPMGRALLVLAVRGADPLATAALVESHVPSGTAVQGWGSSMAYYSGGALDIWGSVFLVAIVALVCGGPVVALAIGVAARRRRDDATLGALGASSRTLAAVGVVETTAVAAVVVGIGMLSGAVLQAAITVAARARDSLKGVITDDYLEVALRAVAWQQLLWIWAGAVAVFAVVSLVVNSVSSRRLPVEQLRMAETGRI